MARLRAPARRRQLLEVAADLFATHGYRGTTTAQLAHAAGVTEPVLYQHFASKLDLFITLIDELGKEVITAWQTALAAADSPRDRLDVLLASNPATHERGKDVYRLLFHAMTGADEDPRIRKAIRDHLKRLHAFIAAEIRSLQKLRVVRRDADAALLAWLLVDLAIGFGIVSPVAQRGDARMKSAAQALVRELLRVV